MSKTLNFVKNYTKLKNNILLIPGPVTTSISVKDQMKIDIGSRQHNFVDNIDKIRENILDISQVSSKNYSCILFQGTGTYTNEAVIGSLPYKSRILTLSNGIYGNRLYDISKKLNFKSTIKTFNEFEKINLNSIKSDININNFDILSLVHHETSNGIVNNVEEICKYIKKYNKTIIVDGISSFGGIPIDIEKNEIDYFVGSSNKCLHGFPGLSFVIAKNELLKKNKKYSKSLSLNLYDQYNEFYNNRQFRYTPPPQIVNALNKSLEELIENGGISKRFDLYKKRNTLLRNALEEYGLESFISEKNQGPIMVIFKYPWNNFNFNEFYLRLLNKNIVIYKAEINNEPAIRLGNIGEITKEEFDYCIECIKNELNNMKKYKLNN